METVTTTVTLTRPRHRPAAARTLGRRLHPVEVTDAWYAAGCPRRLPHGAVSLRVWLRWRLASWLRGAQP